MRCHSLSYNVSICILIPEMLYDVPMSVIVLLSLFYGTISVLSVAGNIVVIWIVATSKSMQTVTNFFIANLALADVTIGMFAIPFQVSSPIHFIYVISSFQIIFFLFFAFRVHTVFFSDSRFW